ncbi:MAG: rhodanese-like domain-containing protein [Lachnospiraceae bacterium]|nr:rhodanese-like domain-containing protein [Lachnospiraceae bacterium]
MKRAKGHGFLLSLLLNMVFRGFWLVLVAVLVILHFAAGWPLWLIAIPLVAWFIHALLITLVLGFATSGPTTSRPEPKNVNPYSAKKNPLEQVSVTNESKATMIEKNEFGTYKHISQAEAIKIMAGDEPYVIVDVRRPDEFAKGHIPGAINVPNEGIADEQPAELPDLDQVLLVHCQTGRRSAEASRKLADIGYTRVLEFGGIMTWKDEVVTD